MGFISNLVGGLTTQPIAAAQVIAPIPQFWNTDSTYAFVTRAEAMQVPAIARARNIICGTIGTLPLWGYNDVTGERLFGRQLLKQADPAMAQAVTIAWTVEDLLFHGMAYWQVLEVDVESGRPTRSRRIDPTRISFLQDPVTGLIDNFRLDGHALPLAGVGSIKVFNGMDDGLLVRAGRTIRAALNLERAASRMAEEPVPSMVITNNGVEIPANKVQELMDAWRTARQNRTTAYLAGNLKLDTFGYDAQSLQLVESRQHLATEMARLVGIPAWYLNADIAGMTYSNVTSERRSLVDFSLRPLISAIEQRLSMDDMTARGTVVRFDLDNYLRGNPNEQLDVVTKMIDYGLIDVATAQWLLDLSPNGGGQ